MSSTTPDVENVVVENVVVTVKEKKPRKPRAPKVTADVSAEPTVEVVSQEAATTEVPVADKKQKKPRKVKTDPVAVPVVAELESEPLTNSEGATIPVESSDVKKPRTPALPAKYNKFLQFGYYLVQSLKDAEGNINLNSVDDIFQQIHLFDSVDNQKSFVQGFFDQSKDINKALRKLNADKKKAIAKAAKLASKPPKPAKNNNKKDKKPTKNDNDDPFVSDIVSLATNKPTKTKPTKTKPYVSNDNHNHNHNLPSNNDDDDDNDELDVTLTVIDGVNFLLDANKRVFDFNSHNLIGHLDNNNLLVLF